MQDTIRAFRRFNRFYTRLLGLLNQRLLNSPLTLAEARVLYEINALPGTSAAELTRLLAMDRGQLSRLLKSLLKKMLAKRIGKPGGRRPLPLEITEQGRAVLDALEAQADNQHRDSDKDCGFCVGDSHDFPLVAEVWRLN